MSIKAHDYAARDDAAVDAVEIDDDLLDGVVGGSLRSNVQFRTRDWFLGDQIPRARSQV